MEMKKILGSARDTAEDLESPRIIAQIVNGLKDSVSGVWEACVDRFGALSRIYLKQGCTSSLPNTLLPSGIQDARESDLHYSPFPTKYNIAATSSLNGPAISMAEALRAASISPQNAMPSAGQEAAALAQHLALNPYSHQPGMPLGYYGNLMSYPFMPPQSYNPYTAQATAPPVPPCSAYGFGGGAASSNNFPLNPTSAVNSYEDVLSSQSKDSNHLASSLQQQNENSTARHQGQQPNSRVVPGSGYYSSPGLQNQQPPGFRQAQQLQQQLPTVRKTKKKKKKLPNITWSEEDFLKMHNVPDDLITSMLETEPSNIKRRVAKRGNIFMLWDVQETTPEEDVMVNDWTYQAGVVRNQADHDDCWTYASTDMCSAWRFINQLTDDFVTLSARHLTFYANPDLRKETDRPDHRCHGYGIAHAIRYIRDNGVPKEDSNDAQYGFSCVSNAPPETPSELYKLPDGVQVNESTHLKDLYRMLLVQPVAANVHYFSPEFDNIGSGVYEGPACDGSLYMGIHSVIIVTLTRVEGKLVAFVKSSHGTEKGVGGYMYVSLTKMIVNVGFSGSRHIEGVHGTTPSFLLTDFTFIESPKTPKNPKSESGKLKSKTETAGRSKTAHILDPTCKETSVQIRFSSDSTCMATNVGSAAGGGGDGGSSSRGGTPPPSLPAEDKKY